MKTHPAWGVAAVVLVLANVVYFAWSHGALAVVGLVPERLTQSEPHRLADQVRPELLRVLKEPPPVRAPEAAAAPLQDRTPQPDVSPTDRSER